jgi:hypothetical protein
MMKAKVKARGRICHWKVPDKYLFELTIQHKDIFLGSECITGIPKTSKSSAIKAAERVAEDLNLDIAWEE